MQQEQVFTTIVGPGPDRLLEIASGVDTLGRPYLELRRLGWGNGVGWYRQQTLQLDPQETSALKRALRELRQQKPYRRGARGKVLAFPQREKKNGQLRGEAGR